MPPSRPGGYELLELLGRGGMGAVYRARDPAGREVALKLLRDPSARTRFEREGILAARLDHPGIVTVHAAGSELGADWIAYELLEGCRELQQALPGASLRQRVTWVRDAARALGVAHRRGIVHRDVKPPNLLIDASGQAKVSDFGLSIAVDLERLTRSADTVGTPLYMAPEQITGRRGFMGPQLDVWALGAVLGYALTEVHPFQFDNALDLVDKIARAEFRSPREVDPALPAELDRLVRDCLQVDPLARPADGEAVARRLDAWLSAEPGAPPPRPAGWVVPATSAGLLACAALGAALLLAPDPEGPEPSALPPAPSAAASGSPAARPRLQPSWRLSRGPVLALVRGGRAALGPAGLERPEGLVWRAAPPLERAQASARGEAAFAASASSRVRVSGDPLRATPLQGVSLAALAISDDGRRCAVGEASLTVFSETQLERRLLHVPAPLCALALTPGEGELTLAGDERGGLSAWASASGAERWRRPRAHPGPILALASAPRLLASASRGQLRLWELEPEGPRPRWTRAGELSGPLAFDPRYTRLAYAAPGELRIASLATGELLASASAPEPVTALSWREAALWVGLEGGGVWRWAVGE